MPEELIDESLRAVADPTRRAILRLVRDREVPAGEIATHFPSISRPAVSQHLRVLADAGLVAVRPDGNRGSTDGGARACATPPRSSRRCGPTVWPGSSKPPSARNGPVAPAASGARRGDRG